MFKGGVREVRLGRCIERGGTSHLLLLSKQVGAVADVVVEKEATKLDPVRGEVCEREKCQRCFKATGKLDGQHYKLLA